MGATGEPGDLTVRSKLQDSFFCALVPDARARSGNQSLFPTYHPSLSCVVPGSLWSWRSLRFQRHSDDWHAVSESLSLMEVRILPNRGKAVCTQSSALSFAVRLRKEHEFLMLPPAQLILIRTILIYRNFMPDASETDSSLRFLSGRRTPSVRGNIGVFASSTRYTVMID
jgi:hypothetical protein